MKAMRVSWGTGILVLSLTVISPQVRGQEHSEKETRQTLITAAREIMKSAGMCALITVDHSGQPRVRTMDPFPPEEGMVIWLGTSRRTRKVAEIRNNPRVTLYYAAPEGDGYVSIYGRAELVDDPEKKTELWKDAWEEFYKDREASYLLIKVKPETVEVLSYSRGILGNPQTWKPATAEF